MRAVETFEPDDMINMRSDFDTAREALVEFAKMIDVAIARTMVAASTKTGPHATA